MDLKDISRLSKTPPTPKPEPEPTPEPAPEPAKEAAPERPVSVYTAVTQPAPAAPAKAKKAKKAPAAKALAAPTTKAKKTAAPAAPIEAEPTVTITLDNQQVQTNLPQLIPFGDPVAREYLDQQVKALQSNPMYRAAVALDDKGLGEKAVDFFLTNPYSERKKEVAEQLRKRTDYDIGVYQDAAARAELLRAIEPDPVAMSNMPPNLDEESKRRYINTAKAVALNNMIAAKRLAPNIKIDRTSVVEGANLDMLEPMLERLTRPKLRPYDNIIGINPLTYYFSSPKTETETKGTLKGAPGTFEAAQRVYSSSMAPYMEPVLRNRGAASPNPQPVPMESPFPDFVNDNIFAPVYAYIDRKRAEAAAKEKQPK